MSLENKIAIITGGTGGLGKAITQVFLEKGAQVVLPYRDQTLMEEFASQLGKLKERLAPMLTDVTHEDEVNKLVAKTVEDWGRIDILINLTGGFSGGTTIAETPESTWNFMMDLNLKSVFLCSKAVLPQMMAQRWGRIVNVSSRNALRIGPRSGAYTVSKAGVITLTQVMAEEAKDYNICVNAILPSTIDTEANRKVMPKADFSRWVKPEVIAPVIFFLASEECGPLSGATIPVYGRA
ncbi:MAG: SDR family oxidoreductase [Chloroflexi bacterium]|nr:SDR family oxidoreductase [Chloroflexota bacterium]